MYMKNVSYCREREDCKNKEAVNRRNEELLREIKSMVETHIDPRNVSLYEGATVLVSALYVGADVRRISALTGISEEKVRIIAQLLRNSRLWIGENVDYQGWTDDRKNAITFVMDACVAEGSLIRTSRKRRGKYVYTATGEMFDLFTQDARSSS